MRYSEGTYEGYVPPKANSPTMSDIKPSIGLT